jgi:protein-disulfide isomerase
VVALVALGLSNYLGAKLKNFPEELNAATTIEAVAEDIVAEASFDLDAASQERIMGDPNAPIKISEHSSLTCGHCGNFHRTIFKEFKAAYIDTGKAYLVFSDFPLNAPALHATKASRCIADDNQYFAFLDKLFTEQESWAYEASYMSYLEKTAGEFGLDSVTFEACVNSQELQDNLVARIQANQSQYGVNSTPSFVINNQITINGGHDFASFDANIQGALAEIKAAAQGGNPAE